MLKGKHGRFRQNLLGKRVDYSGRSVITVGPELKLHQCGLPKVMALELFKPFIYNKLEEQGFVTTIKSAKKLVEKGKKEVWDILEEVIREHPVLLNRAPTLHRLGMQAFEPVLIEGKAIRLHPLVCTAFNADFDGDQMAVHLPLSIEAQIESRVLMMSTNNILSPASGKPIIVPTQDIVLGCYWMTRTRAYALGEGSVFSSPQELRAAYDQEQVDLQARVTCRIRGKRYVTSVGRVLLSEIVPPEVSFENYVNKVMDKKALGTLIDVTYRLHGEKATVLLADRLRTLGYTNATRAGISIGLKDMEVPAAKAEQLATAQNEVEQIINQYQEGLITDGERYNKVVDTWATATETIATAMMKGIAEEEVEHDGKTERQQSFNSVYIMADSGARGSAQQIRQLAGMRGLMAKPSGEIIETPITSNFREGLSVLQYFISTHGARKGLADTALKTANSGYLTRRLVDVSQDAIITEQDCGTLDGLTIGALVESGEIVEGLAERILGRTALEDVRDPYTDVLLVPANDEIDEDKSLQIVDAGIERVRIRSVLTCQARRGVCVECYGRDLARGRKVSLGEAIGVIAAQSIGEPGTQLTMRTFHIGGTASRRAAQSSLESRAGGVVKYHDLNVVVRSDDALIVVNRNGELVVADKDGRERERYSIVYGAKLYVKEGDTIEAGGVLAEWDPFAVPILSEAGGRVVYSDLVEGVTMLDQVDEVTGINRRVVIETKDPDVRPAIRIENDDGRVQNCYLQVQSNLSVADGDVVSPGDVIARIPRETTKTKDITGGLPRVAELFEARRPKDAAVISEIEGRVEFGEDKKGKRRVLVVPEDAKAETREYLIPKNKLIAVQAGDRVRAGEALMDGAADPHDILAVLGEKELARYLVDETQEVYRLQGVKINDKHIEVIVRQMLRRVRVTDVGDTTFLADEHVEKWRFDEENQRVLTAGGQPAVGEPLLLGITKASLSTESFIAAAAFQETTKVLTGASISGRIDHLRGLKENVIMGRLIPAGTGLPIYKNVDIEVESPIDELEAAEGIFSAGEGGPGASLRSMEEAIR